MDSTKNAPHYDSPHFIDGWQAVLTLVTTSRSVLLVDATSATSIPIHRGDGLYYGICRHDGDIVVAARRRAINYGYDASEDRGCLIAFSSESSPIYLPVNASLLDLHGIASIAGAIWCTCSYDNCIAIISNGVSKYIYPLGKPNVRPYDNNHFNTILEVASGYLLLAHNHGCSQVLLLDRNTLSPVKTWWLGNEAHNIWLDGDAMRVCSSKEGLLVGDDGLRIYIGGFPRGYASDGNIRLVGVNENAPRKLRDQTKASISILDMTYRKIGNIDLGDEGMILDIMPITEEEGAWLRHILAKVASARSRNHLKIPNANETQF